MLPKIILKNPVIIIAILSFLFPGYENLRAMSYENPERVSFQHYESDREVNRPDGSSVKYHFDIDWPVEGCERYLYNVRIWIIAISLPRDMEARILSTPEELCKEVIEAFSDSIASERNITAKAEVLDTGFTELRIANEWKTGDKDEAHYGKTTAYVVYVTEDGNKITSLRQTEGEDR